jgi:hypothetical protein
MIKKVLEYLPKSNQNIIKHLSQFLHFVSMHKEVTKMSSENLAIVFAPNLLQPDTPQTAQEMMIDTKHANNLMTTFIEESEIIFGPRAIRTRPLLYSQQAEETDRVNRVLIDNEFIAQDSSQNLDAEDSSDSYVGVKQRKRSLTRKPVGMKQWGGKKRTSSKFVSSSSAERKSKLSEDTEAGEESDATKPRDEITDEAQDTITPWTMTEVTNTPRSTTFDDAEPDENEEPDDEDEWEEGAVAVVTPTCREGTCF